MPGRPLAILGILLTVCGADPAHAAARVCRQLEAELAGGGGARFSAEKYNAAILRQRDEMEVVEGQRMEAGCGFAIAARNVRTCAALNGTIAKMKRNLQVLQRDRRKARGEISARQRIRLMAALDANGCRDQASPQPDREADTSRQKSPAETKADRPQSLDDLLGEKQNSPADTMMPPPTEPPADPDRTVGSGSIVRIMPAPTTVEPTKAKLAERPADAAKPRPERGRGDRKVRVVGPAFLPDPSAAEGLPVPVPKTVP